MKYTEELKSKGYLIEFEKGHTDGQGYDLCLIVKHENNMLYSNNTQYHLIKKKRVIGPIEMIFGKIFFNLLFINYILNYLLLLIFSIAVGHLYQRILW